MKPSPWALTLLASPFSMAVGLCIANEASESIVGNFEVVLLTESVTVASSTTLQPL